MLMRERLSTPHYTERCSRTIDGLGYVRPMPAHEQRLIEWRDSRRGVRRRDLSGVASLFLLALTLSSCAKDPGPTEVPVAADCDARVATTPSTAPGRLLVGYTPYGPNWVTPDFTFVRQHSSIISLHTVVNSKVPWDIFLGDYKSLATYDADLKRDAPAWRNTLCALRSQSYPRPIYLSEEFLLDRGKGSHMLPPRLDGTYPAEFLIGGFSTYRSPAARKAAANLARYLVEFFQPIAFSPFIEFDLTGRGRQLDQEWVGMTDAYHDIYVEAKKWKTSLNPDGIPIFPTFMWNLVQSAEKGGEPRFGYNLIRSVAAKAPIDWIGLSMYPNSEFNFGNILLKPAQIDAKFVEDARRVFNDSRPITISETGWQVCSANGCFENDQTAYVQWLVSEGKRLSMPFLINFFETDPIFTGPTGSITLPFGFRTAAPELRHRPALGVFDAQLP